MQSIKLSSLICSFVLWALAANAQSGTNTKMPKSPNYKVVMTEEAYYPEGESKLYEFLNSKLTFSDPVKQMNDQGVKMDSSVLISFYVDTDSTISEMELLRDAGFGTGKFLIEVVRPLKYVPARENGIPVRTNVILSMPIIIR